MSTQVEPILKIFLANVAVIRHAVIPRAHVKVLLMTLQIPAAAKVFPVAKVTSVFLDGFSGLVAARRALFAAPIARVIRRGRAFGGAGIRYDGVSDGRRFLRRRRLRLRRLRCRLLLLLLRRMILRQ